MITRVRISTVKVQDTPSMKFAFQKEFSLKRNNVNMFIYVYLNITKIVRMHPIVT